MYDKRKFLRSFLVAMIVCIFPYAKIWASSIPYELLSANPGKVLMIDGKDRYSKVIIKTKLNSAERSMFDFGFMKDDLYVPVIGKSRGFYAYAFNANDRVDFALRNSGADHLFGTPDDFIYRLSDNAKYAEQYYFSSVKSSRNLKSAPRYFQALRLDWDVDLDGNPDAHAFLELKWSKYDGMMPVPTAVPLLPAAWFLGSGVLGLVFMSRRYGAYVRPGKNR